MRLVKYKTLTVMMMMNNFGEGLDNTSKRWRLAQLKS